MPSSIDNRLAILIDDMVARFIATRCTEGVEARVFNSRGQTSVYGNESDDRIYANEPDFTVPLLVGNWFDYAVTSINNLFTKTNGVGIEPFTDIQYIDSIGHEEDGTLYAWLHADDPLPEQYAKLVLNLGGSQKYYKLKTPPEGLMKQHNRAVFFRLHLVPYYGAGTEVLA